MEFLLTIAAGAAVFFVIGILASVFNSASNLVAVRKEDEDLNLVAKFVSDELMSSGSMNDSDANLFVRSLADIFDRSATCDLKTLLPSLESSDVVDFQSIDLLLQTICLAVLLEVGSGGRTLPLSPAVASSFEKLARVQGPRECSAFIGFKERLLSLPPGEPLREFVLNEAGKLHEELGVTLQE